MIVTDCGGCGAELKKYGHHLDQQSEAVAFSEKIRDISEVLADHQDRLQPLLGPVARKVTYHDPCHIAHCQGIRRQPRTLLNLVPSLDYRELGEADACCGSAGTYNIAQGEMADRILARKISHVHATGATELITSNPGCLLQLKQGLDRGATPVRVRHLTELLAESLAAGGN